MIQEVQLIRDPLNNSVKGIKHVFFIVKDFRYNWVKMKKSKLLREKCFFFVFWIVTVTDCYMVGNEQTGIPSFTIIDRGRAVPMMPTYVALVYDE